MLLEPGCRLWLPDILWHYSLHQIKLLKDFGPQELHWPWPQPDPDQKVAIELCESLVAPNFTQLNVLAKFHKNPLFG